MERFEFATANRIVFGPGTCAEVPSLIAPLGKRALFVTDSLERSAWLRDAVQAVGVEVVLVCIEKEPDIDLVLLATQNLQQSNCDLVIGFGGGSALDTAKAAAALAANPGDPLDYLEVVGKGQPLRSPSLPVIAIPTTAGTGSEVTRNAVIAVPERRVKVSLRSPFMLPRLAVVDPELTYSLPPALTASTGLDALTQCIEPFVCNTPNPLTDAICREGIRRAARSLRRACEDGSDRAARYDMCVASLCGGLALANARLGAVHGLAGPIGGMFPAPHGAVCGRLLPEVVEMNVRVAQAQGHDETLRRYEEVGQLVLGKAYQGLPSLIRWLHEIVEAMSLPRLAAYGIRPEDFPIIIAQAQKASSMKGNPVPLYDNDLIDVLKNAC
ncbi:MAG: iron-containing alcohol dehydrogenase [Anaerolineales bacterium]|nr:iron-containing alcohol dehydrogenase [Anaerolineales bacterium]